MNKLKLKKGDKVIVVAGKNKGNTGEIIKVYPSKSRVMVRGINIVKRHTKPTQNNAGGIVEKEGTIHISNIAYLDEKENKPSRLGFKILEDGRKVRMSKKSGEVIDK
jgi:large subunit ribosomal protein L24